MNTTWMLAVALKSLVQAVKTRSSCELATLFESQFVESVSYFAMQGTGFSQHWIVTDLEVSDFFDSVVLSRLSLCLVYLVYLGSGCCKYYIVIITHVCVRNVRLI